MIKLSVYVETSVLSYLVARSSQNIITAANQLVTQEWWDNHRENFKLFISQLVIDEAGQGNTEEANKRLAILTDIPLLYLALS
jgi:hypothetical protein